MQGEGALGMVSSYIAWYLFFAGAGAGAFFIGSFVDFGLRLGVGARFERVSSVTDVGLILGPALVALGTVFLVLDLGAPERALQLFFAPSGSLLSAGAWAIALFCATACVAFAFGSVDEGPLVRIAETASSIVATALAVFVMVYAGVYLSIYPAIPFLHTPLVPVLFVCSALVTGAAVLVVVGFLRTVRTDAGESLGALVKLDAVLVLAEALVLVVFVALSFIEGDFVAQSARALLSGDGAGLFWIGVVVLGLVVPLSVDLVCAVRPYMPALMMGAVSTLVGGVCLRFALLLAAERLCLVDMSSLAFWL